MTTIAANHESMSGDSNVKLGDVFYEGAPKVVRIGKNLVGAAGDVDAINKFQRWLGRGKKGRPTFSKKQELYALVLNNKGLFHYDKTLDFDEIKSAYFAIGTGEMIALTAMDFGATPEQAVLAACRRDPKRTREPVHTLRLDGR